MAYVADRSRDTPRRRVFNRRLVRPRSITGLLLTSFGLVALPLILAVILGVVYVNRLTHQSERLVLQGVEITRHSKRLHTLLTAMERSARQYDVLRSDELVERFTGQAHEFDAILEALAALKLDTVPHWNLDALRQQSHKLAQWLQQHPANSRGAVAELTAMRRETNLIADQGKQFVDHELAQLQATAGHARIFLLLCVFALIPGVLALTVFFVFVIARPLRQISSAVTHLGEGDFTRPIRVFAPTMELDALGARLDWMRQRLATLESEKQQFIRHMSHELKTPLASIREGAELLRDGTVGALSQPQREVADILQQNTLELAGLIENLLDFSAWQQQQVKLTYDRFDLKALIERITTRQRLTIESKALELALPRQPIVVTADRDRIQLIMTNLLTNAVKFSPPRGRITIGAEYRDGATTITVADQGPGVAPADRDRIFDAFQQGETAQKDGALRGTGIGLSVVRECIAAHGGHIVVESNPGGGALFRLAIPDRDAP